jgi:hypothetical protein
VPNTALDEPERIFAREFLGVGTALRVRCAGGVVLKGNGRHGDDRNLGKLLFQIVVFRLAFSQPEPPAIIMDDDGNVVRIVEGRRTAIERGVVEVPLRRSELPNQLRKVVPVFVVAGPAAVGSKIVLVPPFELGLRRQGPAGRLLRVCLCINAVFCERNCSSRSLRFATQ